MFRSHTNGELTLQNLNEKVTLSGSVQTIRDKGFMIWIDLRDRYGITQLVFDAERTSAEILENAKKLGREFVIQAEGTVIERSSKNPKIPTGEIEILVEKLTILNEAELPPFTIEDETDGGEELRMKYRYLDIRRNPVKDKLIFRHKMAQKVRNYLSDQGFIEVETPVLIKSTPEGARDFVVPSRMNQGQFYALPQSPQTFKSFQNIFLLYKRHFAIDLGEFRLSVGSQILITETFYDLKIFVHSANHQQLFESLWRLWQCIKLPLIHSARNHEISRSFWCRFYQNGSFYFDEAFI